MLKGCTFDNQNVTSQNDGGFYQEIFSNDGVLWGCSMSATTDTLTIQPGQMIIGGRLIWIDGATSIQLSDPIANGYGQLVLTIDLSQPATQDDFQQVSAAFVYSATTTFPELTQGDINEPGGDMIYQQQLAVVGISGSNITGITSQIGNAVIDAEMLGGSPPSYYLNTTSNQQMTGNQKIIRAYNHLFLMQPNPTGSVGGWGIDCSGAASPAFRLMTLNKETGYIGTAVNITPAGIVTLAGEMTADGFTIGKVDGSLWMNSGTAKMRIHYDKNNALWFHKYSGGSSSPTSTSMVINGDNSVTLATKLFFVNQENVALGSTGAGVLRAYCLNFDVVDSEGNWVPVRASAFQQQSSERYKKDIVDIDEAELNKILDVAVKRFRYKSDKTGTMQTGVIAEQLEDIGLIVPLGYDDEGRPDSVDYSKFTPYLIGIVQRQEKQISELEKKAEKYDALSALLVQKGILTQKEVEGLEANS